jgi:putative endonuclease
VPTTFQQRPPPKQSWYIARPTCSGSGRTVASMEESARRSLGRQGEDLAAQHLRRRGFEIVERNYRTRWGELDLVAFDGRTLVFCEVKTRRLTAVGSRPFDSLHHRKRGQVRRMARQWLAERGRRSFAQMLRFDAIGVTLDVGGALAGLEHLEGAF